MFPPQGFEWQTIRRSHLRFHLRQDGRRHRAAGFPCGRREGLANQQRWGIQHPTRHFIQITRAGMNCRQRQCQRRQNAPRENGMRGIAGHECAKIPCSASNWQEDVLKKFSAYATRCPFSLKSRPKSVWGGFLFGRCPIFIFVYGRISKVENTVLPQNTVW